MLHNRSTPRATVISELACPEVAAAADWLCAQFGFTVCLRIGNHRAQLNVGDGTVIITKQRPGHASHTHSLMIRDEDAATHHAHSLRSGARILSPPPDFPYGERQ